MKCNLKRLVLGKNLGTTAKNSKFYSKWAVSLCSPPLHIEIECSFVKLVINGPCVRAFPSRWVLGKINIFDMLDWFTFSLRKKEAYQNDSFHHDANFLSTAKRELVERSLWICFSQSCVCTVFIMIIYSCEMNQLLFHKVLLHEEIIFI